MSYEIQAMNGDSQVHQLLSIKEPDQKKSMQLLTQQPMGDTVTQ